MKNRNKGVVPVQFSVLIHNFGINSAVCSAIRSIKVQSKMEKRKMQITCLNNRIQMHFRKFPFYILENFRYKT